MRVTTLIGTGGPGAALGVYGFEDIPASLAVDVSIPRLQATDRSRPVFQITDRSRSSYTATDRSR